MTDPTPATAPADPGPGVHARGPRGARLVLTAAEMRAVDRHAIDVWGVPGVVLMENAGRGVVDLIRRERPRLEGARIGIVCGAGQNAGDGFVIARHLATQGADVAVLLANPRSKISGDAAVFLGVLEVMDEVEIVDLSRADQPAFAAALAGADVVVDALFGTGLRDEVRGVPAAAIAAINATAALRVSVDLPSGLNADTGRAQGAAVAAHVTATMGARKLGLVLDPEAPVGRVEVVNLGVPMREPPGAGPCAYWIDREYVFPRLPHRRPTAHKGSGGHLLLVAGSVGKTGAAVLAARTALRAGAGLCTVASTAAGQQALDAKIVEAMSTSYTDGDDAGAGSAAVIEGLAGRMKAAAVGPGVPVGPGMRDLIRHLAATLPLPMVIDADGLNHLGTVAATILRSAPAPRILTPHPGEMARLCGITIDAVAAARLGVTRQLAASTGAVVVLKGARTVVAAPDGAAFVNPAVNPALATAGSGDVLTGLVGGLLAQGLGAEDAAVAGVFLHGLAGEDAATRLGTAGGGLLAGDLPESVAAVLARARVRQT